MVYHLLKYLYALRKSLLQLHLAFQYILPYQKMNADALNLLEKINEETAVLLHILKSKLNDKIKKNLIRNVFFDQYRVVSAIANQEHIDAILCFQKE